MTPRSAPRYLSGDEGHIREGERALSHIAAARERAERASRTILREGGDPALAGALAESARVLAQEQRRLIRALPTPL